MSVPKQRVNSLVLLLIQLKIEEKATAALLSEVTALKGHSMRHFNTFIARCTKINKKEFYNSKADMKGVLK